jgi:hypothetical protein
MATSQSRLTRLYRWPHDALASLACVQVVDVTGRHARRGTGAARWGLRLLACSLAVGVLTGTAFADTLAAVL